MHNTKKNMNNAISYSLVSSKYHALFDECVRYNADMAEAKNLIADRADMNYRNADNVTSDHKGISITKRGKH